MPGPSPCTIPHPRHRPQCHVEGSDPLLWGTGESEGRGHPQTCSRPGPQPPAHLPSPSQHHQLHQLLRQHWPWGRCRAAGSSQGPCASQRPSAGAKSSHLAQSQRRVQAAWHPGAAATSVLPVGTSPAHHQGQTAPAPSCGQRGGRPWIRGPKEHPMVGTGAPRSRVRGPSQPVLSSAGSADFSPAHRQGHRWDRRWPWDALLLCRAWQAQSGGTHAGPTTHRGALRCRKKTVVTPSLPDPSCPHRPAPGPLLPC